MSCWGSENGGSIVSYTDEMKAQESKNWSKAVVELQSRLIVYVISKVKLQYVLCVWCQTYD